MRLKSKLLLLVGAALLSTMAFAKVEYKILTLVSGNFPVTGSSYEMDPMQPNEIRINRKGVVAGQFKDPANPFSSKCFVWDQKRGLALFGPPPGPSEGSVVLTESGRVFARSQTGLVHTFFEWTPNKGWSCVWMSRKDVNEVALSANSHGDLIVMVEAVPPSRYIFMSNGKTIQLPGPFFGTVHTINDDMSVVGSIRYTNWLQNTTGDHVWTWNPTTGVDIMPSIPGTTGASPGGTDGNSHIVGCAEPTGILAGSALGGFIWNGRSVSYTPPSQAFRHISPSGVNHKGQIVGSGDRGGFLQNPKSGPVLLNDILVTEDKDKWNITAVRGISDEGKVVGFMEPVGNHDKRFMFVGLPMETGD